MWQKLGSFCCVRMGNGSHCLTCVPVRLATSSCVGRFVMWWRISGGASLIYTSLKTVATWSSPGLAKEITLPGGSFPWAASSCRHA